jgi:hypothetical protein
MIFLVAVFGWFALALTAAAPAGRPAVMSTTSAPAVSWIAGAPALERPD